MGLISWDRRMYPNSPVLDFLQSNVEAVRATNAEAGFAREIDLACGIEQRDRNSF